MIATRRIKKGPTARPLTGTDFWEVHDHTGTTAICPCCDQAMNEGQARTLARNFIKAGLTVREAITFFAPES